MVYHLEMVDGHRAVELQEGRFLIDTGSPSSFAKDGRISFGGRGFDVLSSLQGMLDADDLSGYVGSRLDGLVGMDLLGEFSVTFARSDLYVDEAVPDATFLDLPTEVVMGIPTIEMEVNGHQVKMFVDTGAKVSYLNPEHMEECAIEEELPDFYPMIGHYTVGVSTLRGTLNGYPIEARFGRPQSLVQMTLMMAGVDGIIGSDLFKAYFVRIGRGGQPVAISPCM